jgi:hypothetical protein
LVVGKEQTAGSNVQSPFSQIRFGAQGCSEEHASWMHPPQKRAAPPCGSGIWVSHALQKSLPATETHRIALLTSHSVWPVGRKLGSHGGIRLKSFPLSHAVDANGRHCGFPSTQPIGVPQGKPSVAQSAAVGGTHGPHTKPSQVFGAQHSELRMQEPPCGVQLAPEFVDPPDPPAPVTKVCPQEALVMTARDAENTSNTR